MMVQDWLGEDNKLGCDIVNNKYIYKNETFDEFLDRISGNDMELRDIILRKEYLHGGRTLSNYNTGNGSSTANCYSLGYIDDDTEKILYANLQMAMTYKAQGGQGLSLSKIRPKGSSIKGGQYETDGIIPFMKIFNTTTESISQGGSRKGALIMTLDVWHKEIEDFITIKTDLNEINKANLSIEIDDEFMKCIEEYYKTGTEPIVNRIFEFDGGSIEYEIEPVKIYKKLCKVSHDYAEPGVLYTNRLRNYNIMEFHPEYRVEICNPCGKVCLTLITPQNR